LNESGATKNRPIPELHQNREALADLHDSGRISAEVIRRVERYLDLEEERLAV
jgi:hypothetical protein